MCSLMSGTTSFRQPAGRSHPSWGRSYRLPSLSSSSKLLANGISGYPASWHVISSSVAPKGAQANEPRSLDWRRAALPDKHRRPHCPCLHQNQAFRAAKRRDQDHPADCGFDQSHALLCGQPSQPPSERSTDRLRRSYGACLAQAREPVAHGGTGLSRLSIRALVSRHGSDVVGCAQTDRCSVTRHWTPYRSSIPACRRSLRISCRRAKKSENCLACVLYWESNSANCCSTISAMCVSRLT